MNRRHRLHSFLLLVLVFNLNRLTSAECPLETDPVTILSCVAIDAVGLVQATKGNLRGFCTMAERFMECVKTKTRGCFGEDFVRGSLSELIELSQKCCVNKGEKVSDDCPFINRPQCFSLTDRAMSINGSEISIKNLQMGDKVFAIDENNLIVPTEIISMIHYDNDARTLFYTFVTETGDEISVTSEHLLYVGNQTFVQARWIDVERHQLYVRHGDDLIQPSAIRSMNIEYRQGYATPLTTHGTLLVNRIGASCYSSIYNHQLGHLAMGPLRWFYQAKQIFGSIETEKTNHSNGVHWYPRTLNNILLHLPPLARLLTTTEVKL